MVSKNLHGQDRKGIRLTPEKPIVIDARNTFEGVQQEYEYMDSNFPGYKLVRQVLLNKEDRLMNVFVIDKKGKQIQLYFDIQSFFGT